MKERVFPAADEEGAAFLKTGARVFYSKTNIDAFEAG
jgi:hypothetical protein